MASKVLDIALALAALGFPVFPCGRNKRPFIKGGQGFLDASTDPDVIRELFARGGVLVGVPTGARSGIDAADLDYRNGAAEWEISNAYRLPETRINGTMHGGRHYLFIHAPGVRNSASLIAPGVDVRGDGGYIIVPPSDGYTIIHDAPIAQWPGWLLERVLARPDLHRGNGHEAPPVEISGRRLVAFVQSVLDRVRAAPEGAKHDTLLKASRSLGGVMAAAGLSEDDATGMLLAALPTATVKDWRNAEDTIADGLAYGRAAPIEFEEREQFRRPVVSDVPHDWTRLDTSEPPPADHGNNGEGFSHAGEEAPNEESAERPEPDNIIPFTAFFDVQEVSELDDFVEDLLVMGAMSVVYGPTNCGKSFLIQDVAMRVAAGQPWRSQAIDRGAVLYLALEGGNQAIRNRLLAISNNEGWNGYDLPFAFITVPIDLRNPDAHVEPLIATVAAVAARFAAADCPVRWIIVDTLARALNGGNENASEDMGALVINCDRLRAGTRCHVTLVHHSGKDEARGARGHSSLAAATDTEIEIIDREGTRTVTITKQRDLPTLEPFAFRLKPVEIGTNRRGKPITTCLVEYEGTPTKRAERHRKEPTHADRALEILTSLCAQSGQTGWAGTPSGYSSVPEDWWRERFYDRAMPGEEKDTKKHAFARAAKTLIGLHKVGMEGKRVWVV